MNKSMKAWESMLDKTSIARYFSGIFESMGVIVTDTSERFTVYHKGDHFEMKEGISEDVDYQVEITSTNVANMKAHGADSAIDADEAFAIMRVLFTPLTASSLKNPLLTKPIFRMFSGIENHIVVHLDHATEDKRESHTIIYLNKEWMVIPGAHGNPKRIFTINPSQAIEYQRKVFVAFKDGSISSWQKFKSWYLKWRKDVSVVVK